MRTILGISKLALAMTASVALISSAPAAVACSLEQFHDNGRYVGGNLSTQVAQKADLIQLVRVTDKRIVSRSYTSGSNYLQFGRAELAEDEPEYIDWFVFTLEAVDTLKGSLEPEPWLIEDPLRVGGYDFSLIESYDPSSARIGLHPNRLPEWLFDRPADDGYAFMPASERSGLGGGECSSPYFLEVGQMFVALRMSDGRLYPADGGFPLRIEADFRSDSGRTERVPINMQSLIPISGPDDPIVQSLRAAISTDR
ncbi:hypothetical protein [Brevundimonas sp.]|uniref:hypothetical protein n=1 Tax=Brevundimonas sp. TaxID=1871086 RepID=UPI003AF59989